MHTLSNIVVKVAGDFNSNFQALILKSDVLVSFILFFMWYDMLFNLVSILSVSIFTFYIACFCDK